MSKGCDYLHSHSGLEIELKFPKHFVLVDEKYEKMFNYAVPFVHNNTMYLKVRTIDFANNGGVFKFLRG